MSRDTKSFKKLVTGSCTEACTVLSSGTASPYSRSSSSSSSLLVPNSSCTCQCNFDLPIFREDLHICVNDIHGKVQKLFVDETKKFARCGACVASHRANVTISDFRYFLSASWSKSSGKSADRRRIYPANSPGFKSSSRITAVFINAINLG